MLLQPPCLRNCLQEIEALRRIGDLIKISRKGDDMTADTSYFGLVDQYAANGKRIRLR